MKSNWLIAVPRPLRNLLTYSPKTIEQPIQAGCRVIVPLGNSRSLGVTMAAVTEPTDESYAVKPIHALIDETPLLDAHILELLQWAARYYHHPIGDVIFTALPVALRDGNLLPDNTVWRVIQQPDAEQKLKRAKRQHELYQALVDKPKVVWNAAAIRHLMGNSWHDYVQGLIEKGLLAVVAAAPAAPKPYSLNTIPKLQLNAAQQACLDQCRHWSEAETTQPILLQGVTGSGKTEIYLRLIEDQLAAQRQTLVLVPEIGLTPQLLQRFTQHFPDHTIACLHSGLNDTERLQAWLQARSGEASIILGTRSAVFTPCAALGLIIVDEEHDNSLKQQEGFRYHARDLAIKRAQMLAIPILLGTATPALETLHNAERGRYHYTQLLQRANNAQPPRFAVQDIRGHTLQAGLSQQSLQAIRETLAREEQVMIFINRRGFAPVLLCPNCGWQATCEACDTHMTFHSRKGRLICHHCSCDRTADTFCPACHHPQLLTQGLGTERIELNLHQQFPKTPVIRIDRDSTSRKGALQQRLDMVQQHEHLILVGTQMLAKGHDFPNLTLVVVLDADQSLFSAEYHALERFGQLITQVSGRAGRAQKVGQVILQTTQPAHSMLLTLLDKGYTLFAKQLLAERQRWDYPPFSYQALIRADALTMEDALAALQQCYDVLAVFPEAKLFGPIPAPLEKRAHRYRAQLLLQCVRRDQRHHFLQFLTAKEKNLRNPKGVRWSIDVDPVELT